MAACGSTPPAEPVRTKPPARTETLMFRKLVALPRHAHATRTTFALHLDGERAELVETEEVADGSFTLERADREAVWRPVSTRTYRGTKRADGIDLRTADMQPLVLPCVERVIQVSRITATPDGSCQWDPAARVTALLCGDDPDEQLVFVRQTAVEQVVTSPRPATLRAPVVEHDCIGLRVIR
jgi:hypothetical protein